MGGTLALGVGAEQTTASISVLSEHAVASHRAARRRAPQSALPGIRAAPRARELRAQPRRRALGSAVARGRGAREARLRRRPSLRPHAAAGRPARRLRHREAPRFLRAQLRRAPHARLRRRALRPRRARGGAAQGVRRLARGPGTLRAARARERDAAACARRQPRSAAVLGAHRRAGAGPVARAVFPDDADEQPARRNLRLAHHDATSARTRATAIRPTRRSTRAAAARSGS